MIKFITFGDGGHGYRAAAKRLGNQARKSFWFDEIEVHNIKSLFSEINPDVIKIQALIDEQPEKLGFYIWKPYLILKVLASMQDGDIMCYLDSGCQLNINVNSTYRLKEYIQFAEDTGGLFMQVRDGEFGINDLSEENWTHPKVLNKMNASNAARSSNQVQAGIIFLKKNAQTYSFVQTWLSSCMQNDFELLIPEPIDSSQESTNHRWEQSIFSVLVKDTKMRFIEDETYYFPTWSEGRNFPIWAMRNRSGGDAFRRSLFDMLRIAFAKVSRN